MKNRSFAIVPALCLALALAACSGQLGSRPVTVPGSAPSSGGDLVSQALNDFDYAYVDNTQELSAVENSASEPQRAILAAGPECIAAQEAVNRAAMWMEACSGMDLAPYTFSVHSLRTSQYAGGERTLWYVDCWQAPEGVDEGSFHFFAYVDAITGDLVRLLTPLPLGTERTQLTRQELEEAAGQLPALFEELGLPAPGDIRFADDGASYVLAQAGDVSYQIAFEGEARLPVSIFAPELWQLPQ